MEEANCGVEDEGRLASLEKKVRELDTLVQQFVQWTRLQVEVINDKLEQKSSSGRVRNRRKDVKGLKVPKTESTASSCTSQSKASHVKIPRRNLLARKSTSGIPKVVRITSLSHLAQDTKAEKSDAAPESIDLGSLLGQEADLLVTVKDEILDPVPVHYFIDDDENSNEETDEFWFPTQSSGNSSDSDGDDSRPPVPPRQIGEEEDDISKAKTEKRRRTKSSPDKVKRQPRRQNKKRVTVWNWPPPDSIKGPFVSLPRVSQENLAEYGLKVPCTLVKKHGPYTCEKCPSQFRKKTDYISHARTHRVPKRYTCSYCGRIDKWKNRHFTHVRTHTGEKPNLCEICGVSSNSSSSLSQHKLRVHFKDSRSKQVKCDSCDKTFFTKAEKFRHENKVHKDVNVFQDECKICNIKFQDSFKAKRHKVEVHESQREFKCNLCDQPFKRKQHLAKHLKRHEAGLKRKRGPQKSSSRVYPALEQVEEMANGDSDELKNRELPDNSNTNVKTEEEPIYILPSTTTDSTCLRSDPLLLHSSVTDTIDADDQCSLDFSNIS